MVTLRKLIPALCLATSLTAVGVYAATTATTTTTQKTAMTKPISSLATSARTMIRTTPAAAFLTIGVRVRVGSRLEAMPRMLARPEARHAVGSPLQYSAYSQRAGRGQLEANDGRVKAWRRTI